MAACRLALALGLDVSGSVDSEEYRLQREGLAAALSTPAVEDALLMGGMPVAVAVYEWSGHGDAQRLVEWTLLEDRAGIAQLAATLISTERVRLSDSTALGDALVEGGMLLAEAPPCWRHVLDISGDGMNNDGPEPADVHLPGVTVNALVIGTDDAPSDDRRAVQITELSSYFRTQVIRGPGAFVQVALGYADYAAAMERKLLRELAPVATGALAR